MVHKSYPNVGRNKITTAQRCRRGGVHSCCCCPRPGPLRDAALQVAVQATRDQLAELASAGHHAAGSADAARPAAGGSSGDRHDVALQRLAERPDLQGRLLGQLQHVLQLALAHAAVPVNAVLQEACNLVSCFVVTDRQAANQARRASWGLYACPSVRIAAGLLG